MTLGDIRDWLEARVEADYFGTAGVFSTEEKQIIILDGRAFTNPRGFNSSYYGKGARILVHWNKNSVQSELKAQEVYNIFYNRPEATIGGQKVKGWLLRDPAPVLVGMNDRGIFEYVIDLELVVQRS